MGDIDRMKNRNLVWDLRKRKTFFSHELLEVDDLFSLLHSYTFSYDKDNWKWNHSRVCVFCVASTFVWFFRVHNDCIFNGDSKVVKEV